MTPRSSHALNIQRLPQHLEKHYEIKDPSVVQVAPDKFMMYASVGNSIEQSWKVGRFVASNPSGVWQEIEPVEFHDLLGPQLCAPAVVYEEKDGKPLWSMYIQTACFEENGIIALATSEDGQHFYGTPQPLATKDTVEQNRFPVVGVYDVGISTINMNGEQIQCMLYSGYRRIGCGDIYLSTKRANESEWSRGVCLLTQEDVPFHNRPDYEHFEWGLEGAKLEQLADDCFLLIGVCFVPKPNEFLGTRQRVFYAVGKTPIGPFTPIDTPFLPHNYEERLGENGHPDTLVLNDKLYVIYQQRAGNGHPWYLRVAEYGVAEFKDRLLTRWEAARAQQAAASYPAILETPVSNSPIATPVATQEVWSVQT